MYEFYKYARAVVECTIINWCYFFLHIPCNVCNEGFDQEDEVQNHIEVNHKDIYIKISQNIENSESEDNQAFLARFEDDGNLIG